METVTLRIKSSRGPYRRAGFEFARPRQWHEFEVEQTPEEGMRLNAVLTDPNLTLQVQFEGAWLSWTDFLVAYSAFCKADNTQLPTAEPTLEREASEMTTTAMTLENPAETVVNDTSSSAPPASTSDGASAPIAVAEAAPTVKTETRPAPKAAKPKA